MDQQSRLQEIRIASGLNHKDFAESFGLSASGYHSMLKRKTEINSILARAIAYEWQISPEWLLSGKGQKTIRRLPVMEKIWISLLHSQNSLFEESAIVLEVVSHLVRLRVQAYFEDKTREQSGEFTEVFGGGKLRTKIIALLDGIVALGNVKPNTQSDEFDFLRNKITEKTRIINLAALLLFYGDFGGLEGLNSLSKEMHLDDSQTELSMELCSKLLKQMKGIEQLINQKR